MRLSRAKLDAAKVRQSQDSRRHFPYRLPFYEGFTKRLELLLRKPHPQTVIKSSRENNLSFIKIIFHIVNQINLPRDLIKVCFSSCATFACVSIILFLLITTGSVHKLCNKTWSDDAITTQKLLGNKLIKASLC